MKNKTRRSVLVTGSSGYIGRLFTRALAAAPGTFTTIVAADVRPLPAEQRSEGVLYEELDVRDERRVDALIAAHHVDTVVHLASIVTPGKGMTRDLQYEVDVLGTEHVLRACVRHGVKKLVVTSSGAAYGYHPENAPLLTEDMPLRGNREFAYAHHKRLVEELLSEYRARCPALGQLVFRLGTVLGPSVHNQITDLFEKPVVVGVRGSDTPFVLIHDEDVVAILLQGVRGEQTGVFNVAGDGVVTLREIAKALHHVFLPLPARVLETGLKLLQRAGRTQYGPEQVAFLRYRPVLSNERLKREFGYTPRRTTREVFALYRESRRSAPPREKGWHAA